MFVACPTEFTHVRSLAGVRVEMLCKILLRGETLRTVAAKEGPQIQVIDAEMPDDVELGAKRPAAVQFWAEKPCSVHPNLKIARHFLYMDFKVGRRESVGG